MLQARLPQLSRRESFDLTLIGITLAALVALVARLAAVREGNLTWDDAEYLYQGLEMSLWAKASGNLEHLRAISNMMHIPAKPPLLHGWIAQLWLWFGYRSPVPVIVGATAVPFGLLALAVVTVAWRLFGSRVALLAILSLAASPAMMALGPKILVETVPIVVDAADLLLSGHPDRTAGHHPCASSRRGAGPGSADEDDNSLALIGGVPLCPVRLSPPPPDRRHPRRWIACVLLPIVVLAGPWYLKNGKSALAHAVRSSSFNRVVSGGATVPRVQRVIELIQSIIGWPLLLALIAVGLWANLTPRGSPAVPEGPGREFIPEGPGREFIKVTASGFVVGAILLLLPDYFETRFLFPAWPAMAIVIAALLQEFSTQGRPWRRAVPPLVLALALGSSINAECHEHRWVTYWQLEGVIQKLMRDHGIKSLALLGNTGDWNFFKLRLINDLRCARESPPEQPSKIEISDLGMLSADDVVRTLDHDRGIRDARSPLHYRRGNPEPTSDKSGIRQHRSGPGEPGRAVRGDRR